MNPYMAVLIQLIQAGVCVPSPPVMLEGHKVQVVTCSTSGINPEPQTLQPGGALNPMRPDLRRRS